MRASWEEAFVATCVTLGVPLADTLTAVGDAGALRASALVRGLREKDRSRRAHALATAIAEVATDLDAMRWR